MRKPLKAELERILYALAVVTLNGLYKSIEQDISQADESAKKWLDVIRKLHPFIKLDDKLYIKQSYDDREFYGVHYMNYSMDRLSIQLSDSADLLIIELQSIHTNFAYFYHHLIDIHRLTFGEFINILENYGDLLRDKVKKRKTNIDRIARKVTTAALTRIKKTTRHHLKAVQELLEMTTGLLQSGQQLRSINIIPVYNDILIYFTINDIKIAYNQTNSSINLLHSDRRIHITRSIYEMLEKFYLTIHQSYLRPLRD